MSKDILYYELTPAQDMINFMLKYSFFHKQVIQIPACVTVEKDFDFDLMKKAINVEIQRNDCMRIRFKKKHGKQVQYFLDEYKLTDIPVYEFSSKQEQDDLLGKDAKTPVHHMKGELFRFILFKNAEGKKGIYINVSHLIMDAAAVFVFFNDLFAVYDALEQGTEMPKPLAAFKDAIKKELDYIHNEEKTEKDKEFYRQFFVNGGEPIFNGVHGPELLLKARQKKKNPNLRVLGSFDPIHDKAELSKHPIAKEDADIILKYLADSHCSPECLVQLGMRLHIAKLNAPVNDGIIDTYFVTLCTRRKTLSDKRCGGTMTSTLPWRIVLDRSLTFSQAIDKLQELQHLIFRHQDYPFTAWRDVENKVFNYSLADGTSTMMFSWFPLEKNTMNGWDYDFSSYSIGHYVMPLYTYAMKDARNDSLKFAYLYRTNNIKQEHIDALHNNTVKALKLGCANPDMTIGEIWDIL